MKSPNPWLLIILIVGYVISCGITDPKFIDYAEENQTPTPTPTSPATTDPCVTAAVAAFTTNVDAVLSPCYSCHASVPKLPLKASSASANREAMRTWSKWTTPRDGQTMVTYITSSSHPGASSAGVLSLTKLKAWLDTEICGG